MTEAMITIESYFEISPVINKTISRICRDTRFSEDKSLYKNTMPIIFKRQNKDWKDAPACFFEISPDSYCYEMELYSASKETMDRFREMIDKKPEGFPKAILFYSKPRLFVEVDKYKQISDENKPEEIQDCYQKRNLCLVCNRMIDNRLFSRDLVNDLIFVFKLLAPSYHNIKQLKLGGKQPIST